MRKGLVRWTVALVIILGAVALLTACQPAAPATPTPTPRATPTATPAATPTRAPGTAPNLPANHAGRPTCKGCHEQGVAGAPKWPANHTAFPDALATCQACHKGP